MRSPRRPSRVASASRSRSGSSTSAARAGEDDEYDSFSVLASDSQSSLAPSASHEHAPEAGEEQLRQLAERRRLSPISRLPAEVLIAVFAKLSGYSDLLACMRVCRGWSRNSVALLWHRPKTTTWQSIHTVARSLMKAHGFFDYAGLVKRLNLSFFLNHEISDGTLLPFARCKRVERLTLTDCVRLTDLSLVQMLDGNRSLLALDITGLENITDRSMYALANNCFKLQGFNITNCKGVTDDSLCAVSRKCRHLKRLKFNGCAQLTDKAVMAFALSCPSLLEVDLQHCRLLEDDSVSTLISEGRQLRELRLAHCSRITDAAFSRLPFEASYDSLRILDLTDCGEIQDSGVQKIVAAAPRLRNLVLAKCRQLTDRAVMAITRLGKNLHYIHLGHCSRITDAGVQLLVRHCNRIRYLDLACCQNLTDHSVQQLATLPKLKRIGLVKCGNITDGSILALAQPKQASVGGPLVPCSLERVHLSYCTLLTLTGIHMLLNNCPRLTHLSLTGVQAFLRDDLVTFCREAPREFNDHQRDMFCVFSGVGVTKLRDYLNDGPTIPAYGAEPTNFTEEGDGGDTVNVYAGHGAGAGAGIDTGAGAGAAAGAVPAGPPFAVDEYHHQGVVQQQVAGVAAWLGATFIEEVDNDLDENSVFTDEN